MKGAHAPVSLCTYCSYQDGRRKAAEYENRAIASMSVLDGISSLTRVISMILKISRGYPRIPDTSSSKSRRITLIETICRQSALTHRLLFARALDDNPRPHGSLERVGNCYHSQDNKSKSQCHEGYVQHTKISCGGESPTKLLRTLALAGRGANRARGSLVQQPKGIPCSG
jgi:hypothetical protein